MRKNAAYLIGVVLFVLWTGTCTQDKKKVVAEGAANDWLKLVDAGNYAQSWDESASAMKAMLAREQWQNILQVNRAPLGAPASRKLKSAQYTEQLPGAPSGEYYVFEYASTFADNRVVTETVTPMLDKDGKWRVSVYYIK